MNISTKYDIGHTFWVPRVYKQTEKQELVWEGETWYKEVEVYVPFARIKKIVCIEIRVGRKTVIMYGVKNIGDDMENELTQYHQEENINNYTEEQALAIAREYADVGKTYYGN
jgi:hypothetical protein